MAGEATNRGAHTSQARLLVPGIIALVLLAGLAVGIHFLPIPYFASVQVLIFILLVVLISAKLCRCLKLASGSDYYSRIWNIAVWFAMAVFIVVADLWHLLRAEQSDCITLGTNVALYLTLLFMAESIEQQLVDRRVAAAAAVPGSPEPAGSSTEP
ncbi:MAG: hypothetical protein KatS3mg110_0320 [Pirellulaceae bacterium]|nr:MAG: hypothetical protein KatS3mg110_0320 [Pirellulaceae bacterium]